MPSKLDDVQSYTLSRLCFMFRKVSQLSQPSFSNCSNVYEKKKNIFSLIGEGLSARNAFDVKYCVVLSVKYIS
jgi:hypothetical protein